MHIRGTYSFAAASIQQANDDTLAIAPLSSFDVIMAADGVEFHQESTAFLVRAEHWAAHVQLIRPLKALHLSLVRDRHSHTATLLRMR